MNNRTKILYVDGTEVKVGDLFTDGGYGREETRTNLKGKILYVDKFNIVWFPISNYSNELTTIETARTETYFIKHPKKITEDSLTQEELNSLSLIYDIY